MSKGQGKSKRKDKSKQGKHRLRDAGQHGPRGKLGKSNDELEDARGPSDYSPLKGKGSASPRLRFVLMLRPVLAQKALLYNSRISTSTLGTICVLLWPQLRLVVVYIDRNREVLALIDYLMISSRLSVHHLTR